MTVPGIALVGKARSGKDTFAARLVERYSYTKAAFADPLRAVALAADPIVSADSGHFGYLPVRLSEVVERHGWEKAKTTLPEVRRTLQNFGQAVRDVDPNFWLNLMLERLDVAASWNLPVVVTDTRYVNEATALRARGFKLVRIVRPGAGTRDHVSETELDNFPADVTVANVGTVADLHAQADLLVQPAG
ncbi:deoxynucleotide monophosphate kinase family protein [Kitasatospora sp. NPDC001132]